VEKRIRLLFLLIKAFFVINEEDVEEWLYRTRINTLALVKQGFSRDEVFFMSCGELQDYIKILNDNYEQEEREIENQNSKTKNNINDLKMAGNTLPKGYF
jgi:hypothetical protein